MCFRIDDQYRALVLVNILQGIPHGGIKEREQLWFQTVTPKQKIREGFALLCILYRMVSCPQAVGLGGHSTAGMLLGAAGPAFPPAEVVLLFTRGETQL